MTDRDSASSVKFAELHGLIAANLSREITPEQSRRLNELLRDPATLDLYLEIVYATGTLLTWAGFQRPDQTLLSPPSEATNAEATAQSESTTQPKASSPAKSPVLGFLGGAIDYVNHSRTLMFSLVALLVGGWFAFQLGSLMMGRGRPGGAPVAVHPADPNAPAVSRRPGSPSAPLAPRQGGPVASMTALVDCHWRVVPLAAPPASTPAPGDVDTTGPLQDDLFQVGSELSAGQQLELVRGLAEITFQSGARVVLNGPAHFMVGSSLGGKLQVGKLTARVPHDAHGFTVHSPAGEVVDLGTEFGVAVGADHSMAVEVFVGEVAVDSSADGQTPGPSQKVEAGHAVRVSAGQPVVSIPLDPKRFVRGLGPREDSKVAQSAYLDFVRSLKPVVWFRMEGEDKDRVLHDEMGGPDAKLSWAGPGNPFVASRVGKGLWLRGSQLKDGAVAPSYPQAEHGKLSVAAWVYAASFPHGLSSPALSSSAGGQFLLGIFGSSDGKRASLLTYLTQRDGKPVTLVEPAYPFPVEQWQHIAFTTDGATSRLYRQGREVKMVKVAGLQSPVQLRALGIGVNPNSAGTAAGGRYWDGKLDEIAIFNDVLSADDIHKLAEAPPQ